MKNVGAVAISASGTELAPHGVVDRFRRHAIVLCELVDRLARAVPLDDDVDADPLARERRSAEASARVDDDALGLLVAAGAHHRKEAHGEPLTVPSTRRRLDFHVFSVLTGTWTSVVASATV